MAALTGAVLSLALLAWKRATPASRAAYSDLLICGVLMWGQASGINNKIRVIQRRAYGLRDEEYLRFRILACMLPEI
ncbi:MAG: transposase [Isosphaeraceae bacterium]